MFGLIKRKDKNLSAEEIFWEWFISYKTIIEKFIDSDNRNYSIYDELTNRIRDYNKLLFPELTKESEKYILIITPDGIKEGIEPTRKLALAAPDIENWIVKIFRQPTDEITLNFDGLEYLSSDIEIFPTIDNEREVIDIQVFIKNMNKDESKYQSLAFLYFDHILGEFNSMTKVGYIDFYNLEEGETVEDGITLLELRNLIAQELY